MESMVPVVVVGLVVSGAVAVARHLDDGLCATGTHGAGHGVPARDRGTDVELAAARSAAVDLTHRQRLLDAVPAVARTSAPDARRARIDERLAQITPELVGTIMAPGEVDRTLTNYRTALAGARLADGDGAVLDSLVEARTWGPMAIDGDEALGCFQAAYGLLSMPNPRASGPVDADGWYRWTELTYVRLTRAPGGPWRLLAAFTPAQG
jgi:hypothetical protein